MTRLMESVFPTKRLKYVVSLRRSRVDGSEDARPYIGLENIESWTGRLIEDSASINEEHISQPSEGTSLSNTFEPGDVLFGKLRPYLAKTWVAEFSGRSTTELLVMQPTEAESRFLRYVFLWRDFVDSVDASTFGSKMPRADWNFVGNILVPLPSLEQQHAIADYLDRETARIDALIVAKERLLELLAEKRRALITRAVTRGLDPDVPLRDSGIPWLGEIPAHWDMRMLRFACDAIETGGTPSADFLDDTSGDGINWFTPGDFGDGIRLLQSARQVSREALVGREVKMFPAGTVFVVGIGATLGKVGFIEEQASANQQINALIPRKQVDTKYLTNLLTILSDLMVVSANSATLPILNQQRMGELPVLVPPIREQTDIVSTIAVETEKIDRLTAATERTITFLKERRTGLIAAAVTGQVDVGDAL